MSCIQTIQDYGLRSIGYGERLLPRSDFTLCEQFTLIGSGMIWNIYFGIIALTIGFFSATMMALAKNSDNKNYSAACPLVHLCFPWITAVYSVFSGL